MVSYIILSVICIRTHLSNNLHEAVLLQISNYISVSLNRWAIKISYLDINFTIFSKKRLCTGRTANKKESYHLSHTWSVCLLACARDIHSSLRHIMYFVFTLYIVVINHAAEMIILLPLDQFGGQEWSDFIFYL